MFKKKLDQTKITSYRNYTDKDDNHRFAVVRLSNNLIDSLGGRYSWIAVESETGKKIYRTIRGAGNKDIKKDQIELDYDSIVDLELHKTNKSDELFMKDDSGFRSCNLSLKQIGFFRKIEAHFKHPDQAYRAPMQLAIIMAFISLFSLILGIISFLK